MKKRELNATTAKRKDTLQESALMVSARRRWSATAATRLATWQEPAQVTL